VTDVVEQGRPDRRTRLPGWARRTGLAAALVAAAAVLIPRLGFGADPTPPDRDNHVTAGARQSPYVVMRVGQQVVRYDRFGVAPGPELPASTASGDERVFVATDDAGASRFFTVVDGRLLRVEPGRDRASDLGAVTRIVDASRRPGRLFVQTAADEGGRVVTVDADSGQVVDRAPFPDDVARRRGYQPIGVLSQFGVDGLVLQRPAEGGGEDLAVTWATAEVKAGRRPGFQPIGRQGDLLGLTDDWLLLLKGACPGPTCTLVIVSFDRDRFAVRDVRPPVGWSFTRGSLEGLVHGDLVPVVPEELQVVRPTAALARLAAGGASALLVAGTEGVVQQAGLVARDGNVFFVSLALDGIRRAVRWTPAAASQVRALADLPPLPDGAALVCVCVPVRGGSASTEP
jgi:hypothetical protein